MVQAANISPEVHADIVDLLTSLQSEVAATPAAEPDTPKASIREFILDADFLGMTDFWPKALDDLEELKAPGRLGGVLEVGIGGGKTFLANIPPLYDIYQLEHMQTVEGIDLYDRFKLDKDSPIYVGVYAASGKIAKGAFRYMKMFANRCKWFKQHLPIDNNLTQELHFRRPDDDPKRPPRYIAFAGHSKLTSAISLNLFSYVMDECNFYMVAESAGSSGKIYAEELDQQLGDRVNSRFGEAGTRIYISSRNTVNDFTARKKLELQKDPTIASKYFLPPPRASWTNWPDEKNETAQWRLFDVAKYRWVEENGKPIERKYDKTGKGFWVPNAFWDSFTTNPEKALKNLGSIPSEAQEPFFRLTHKIAPDYALQQCVLPTTKPTDWMEGVHHFNDLVRDDWFGSPEDSYYWHCDQSLNRDGTGLVITRSSGVDSVAVENGEQRPEYCGLVDVEGLIYIKAPKGGEVVYQTIREILFWLSDERGFRLSMGSFDSYNSKDSMQILNARGLACKHLSMDQGKEGIHNWMTTKDAVYEERIFFPPAYGQTEDTTYAQLVQMADRGDPSAVLQVELRQLEIVNGRKVDHPPHGSKDMADAFCGSCIHALKYKRPGGDV